MERWLPIRERIKIEPEILTSVQLQTICGHLSLQTRSISEFLIQGLARRYQIWSVSAVIPRSVSRYQLRSLAHFSSKIQRGGRGRDQAKSELAFALFELEPSLKRMLLDEIDVVDPDGTPALFKLYGPSGHPSRLVQQAALRAEAKIRTRGDYANIALQWGIANLVFFWALFGDSEISVSKRVSDQAAAGAFTTSTSSLCGQFILDFFRAVDPDLNVSTVTNAFAARITYLNSAGIVGLDQHRLDVAKLLSGEEPI